MDELPTTTDPTLQPGTPDGAIRETQLFRQQRTLGESAADALSNSVAGSMWDNLTTAFEEETAADPAFGTGITGALDRIAVGVPAILGQRGKWGVADWNKTQHYDELTKDIPREFWGEVMEQDTLLGAQRVKTKIIGNLEREHRLSMQNGVNAAVSVAVGMADVDLPLVFATGGAFGAAKVAGKALYTGARAGVKSSLTTRAAGVAAGANAGLQAGAITGGLGALNSPTSDWMDAVDTALTTTIFGAAIGGAIPQAMLPLRQAQADFRSRVAAGEPSVWSDDMVRATDDDHSVSTPEDFRQPFVMPAEGAVDDAAATPDPDNPAGGIPAFRGPEAKGLSAQAVQGPPIFQALVDPAGDIRPQAARWVNGARQWLYSTGFDKSALDTAIGQMAMHPVFNIGTNNVAKLVKSQSAVANWLVGTVFEVPSRAVIGDTATAAILKDMYEGRGLTIIADDVKLAQNWAALTGNHEFMIGSRPVGVKPAGMSAYNRQVYMYLNELQRTGKLNPATTAADQIAQDAAMMYSRAGEEVLGFMKGTGRDVPMHGAENLPAKAGYFPYRHNGSKMLQLITEGASTKDDFIAAYKRSYLSVGMITDPEVAEAIATAVVTRSIGRSTRVDESMMMLFSEDGREFLDAQLRTTGMSAAQVDSIMKRFDGEAADRGKLGALKSRNELDFSTVVKTKNGRRVQLVDLMDDDLPTIYQRYVRQMAGGAALARKGITSRANRTEIIEAIQAEQRAIGEEVQDGDLLRAMFSTFDGGPETGYAKSMGSNNGIGAVAELKSLASLSVLTFNGFAQMAETGLGIAAVGLNSWYARGIGPLLDTAMAKGNRSVLEELAVYSGRIGADHLTIKPHLQYDESREFGNQQGFLNDVMKGARKWVGRGNMIQGYTSLLNLVRGKQQEIAVLGMADKVMRTLKAGGREAFEQEGRMFRDLGLDPDHYDKLRALIDNGTIEFDSLASKFGPIEFTDRLNFHAWGDDDLVTDFVAALVRNQHQLVQRTLAGESDRWMHTAAGAAITHLQTFPLLAVQKQFMRNAMRADGQAVAATMWGIGTAYAALSIRDTITGNDRSYQDRARAAFGYSGVMGWVPLYSDPLATMIGAPDLRFNQFGAYAKPLQVPMVDIANDLFRAPGAAVAALTEQGGDTRAEREALRAIPFYRLIEAAKNMASISPANAAALRAAGHTGGKSNEDALREAGYLDEVKENPGFSALVAGGYVTPNR